MRKITKYSIISAWCAVALNLSACGGGGSESSTAVPSPAAPPTVADPGAPVSYTISGKVNIAETADIDSDTNDPAAEYKDNDDTSRAQAINNPTLVTGHLALKGQAASGPNNDLGDLTDVYKTKLLAGQVVELEFAAKPEDIDVDLFILDANGKLVGQSVGENRYECVKITTTGDYFISADIFAPTSVGDTTYQLRISAPGTGAQCNTATAESGPNIVPKSVLTLSTPSGTKVGKSVSTEASGDVNTSSLQTLTVPDGTIKTLNQNHLAMKSVSAKSLAAKRIDPQTELTEHGYKIASDRSLDANSRDTIRTVAYVKALRASGNYSAVSANTFMYATQTTPPGSAPNNDLYYSRQRWHYEMISLPSAFETINAQTPRPTLRPIAAVIDTGIVADHRDITSNLIAGYDFIADPTSAGDGGGYDSNPDDATPSGPVQPSFHGTHVAGTIAAVPYNGVGALGVAPMALIMPLRVLGVKGGGRNDDILQAMLYAAGLANKSGTFPVRKADVINMSLGGSGLCDPVSQGVVNQVRTAGVVIVAASGNDSSTTNLVPIGNPANCSGVISVGALDAKRQRASYSNGGQGLRITAPGGDTEVSTTGNGLPDGIFSLGAEWQNGVRRPGYRTLDGTSMATPHVAGVVALMKWANPNLTGVQIETLLVSGKVTDDVGAAGYDIETGVGLINAKRAVDAAIAAIAVPGNPTPAPAPVAGRIEASPSLLGFGPVRSDFELLLQKVGAVNDRVVSVTSNTAAITVAPKAGKVDANGLGIYVVTIDRTKIGFGPLPNAQITVATSSKPIIVPISAEKRASANSGNLGPMYVLVIDADSADGKSIAEKLVVAPTAGSYNYSITLTGTTNAPPARNIQIYAGTDLDNDGTICSRGEACGAYPLVDSAASVLPLTKSYSGLDFSASISGGIGAASRNTNVEQSSGIRRAVRLAYVSSRDKK
jgi:serine protease